VKNIKYSLGTNGVFLDEGKLIFLKKNNVKIYLSVDNIDGKPFLEKKDFYGYQDMIEINFINDPDFLYNSKATLDLILEKGFKDINFMPVFTTKKRGKEKLRDFLILKNYISSLEHLDKGLKPFVEDLKVNYFSYFNGFSSDIQFMLDTDMHFYRDLDSLIWLQKQYSSLPEDLRKELHEKSQLFHL
jgi:sulfatase maturation enzyme AslB (radical SAM superfamily)